MSNNSLTSQTVKAEEQSGDSRQTSITATNAIIEKIKGYVTTSQSDCSCMHTLLQRLQKAEESHPFSCFYSLAHKTSATCQVWELLLNNVYKLCSSCQSFCSLFIFCSHSDDKS